MISAGFLSSVQALSIEEACSTAPLGTKGRSVTDSLGWLGIVGKVRVPGRSIEPLIVMVVGEVIEVFGGVVVGALG
jgi:hypothetical protein